jgi:Tol biopolymer transport system component
MKRVFLLVAVIFQFSIANCQTTPKDFPVLKGPYLGQKPPGNIPELFAPGTVSRDDYFEHSAAIFSPDGNEVYWSGKPNGARYFEIYFMKMINGKWTEPKIAFSREGNNFNNPVFSSDGNKLFFKIDGDIWFVERQGDEWSDVAKISSVINSAVSDDLHTILENGSVYFRRYYANEQFGKRSLIYISRKTKNGNYADPELLESSINSVDSEELSVFVAPDESYMIIEANKDGRTDNLFISYIMQNDRWSERIKLPFKNGRFPSVSPDGKYLFYMTRDEGIYWVNTSFIEEFKPKGL